MERAVERAVERGVDATIRDDVASRFRDGWRRMRWQLPVATEGSGRRVPDG